MPETFAWSLRSCGMFSFTKICLRVLGLEMFCWGWIPLEWGGSLDLGQQLHALGAPTSWYCSPAVSATLLWVGSGGPTPSWLLWYCSVFSLSFWDLKQSARNDGLRHYATSWKVVGSRPNEVAEFFPIYLIFPNPVPSRLGESQMWQ
jgi:hypothetical protein